MNRFLWHMILSCGCLCSAAVAQDQERALPVRALAFSADGKWLAVARGAVEQKRGDLTVWDVAKQKPVLTRQGQRGFSAVAFSGDSQRLAVSSEANAAMILDIPSGKVIAEFPHPDSVSGLDLSGDGKTLVTACRDNQFRVWDVANRKERYALPTKRLPSNVSIHPDGRIFLMLEKGGVVAIDAETGKPRFQLDQGANAHVYFALFSADGRWIFTSDNHARLLVWDAKDGSRRATVGRAYAYNALAYHPRSEMLATGNYNRRASLLRVRLGQPTAEERKRIESLLDQLDDEALEIREKASAELLRLGFLVDRELQRAAEQSPSAEVRMRARWLREQIMDARFAEFPVLPSPPRTLAFSPDGSLLACGCLDGWTYLWDLEQKKEIARLSNR